jgi:tetratricopeptide (TPR) repeat protein
MLVDAQGFGPMVRLLEAFDAGADLDRAFSEVFRRTPEELDQEFLAFVDAKLAGLSIEPRWSESRTTLRAIQLGRRAPQGDMERLRAWREDWCRVAWGRYWAWQGSGGGDSVPVDVDEALRLASQGGELPPSGLFLRGELALARGERAAALADLRAGFAAGGEDYRARMALGSLLAPPVPGVPGAPDVHGADPPDAAAAPAVLEAIEQYRAAELAFPGYDDPHFSAELELAKLLEATGNADQANEARMRWLAYNADNFEVRVQVGEWLDTKGRFAESAVLWEEANEVDPFRRHVHVAWGRALARLGRHEEALREFRVAREVSSELDGDLAIATGIARAAGFASLEELAGLSEEELAEREGGQALERAWKWARDFRDDEAEALGEEALVLVELGRSDEARAAVEKALAIDPDCASALAARERLDANGGR